MCDIICMGAFALQASRSGRQPSILRSRRCGDPKTHSSLHAGLRTSRRGETTVLLLFFVRRQVVGLGVTGWFVYRYLGTGDDRQVKRNRKRKKGGPFMYTSLSLLACCQTCGRVKAPSCNHSRSRASPAGTQSAANEIIHFKFHIYQYFLYVCLFRSYSKPAASKTITQMADVKRNSCGSAGRS